MAASSESHQGALFADSDESAVTRPEWSGALLAAVLRLPGIGPVGALELARACPYPSEYEAKRVSSLVSQRLGAFLPGDLPTASESHDAASCVGYFDADYPEQLREIANPPPVLWVAGTLPRVPSIAVVGTRKPSAFGRGAARAAVDVAVALGLNVVSGLALGIDTIAHEEALQVRGTTTAVVASGVDVPSPVSNRDLATAIIESGGGIVSENPPGSETTRAALVQRNRIQSAMAIATFIAESGIPGGTLHCVRFTVEQGRKLLVAFPSKDYQQLKSTAANLALTDPRGIEPEILGAKGKTADLIQELQPVADFRIDTSDELRRVLEQLLGELGRSSH